MQTVNDETIVHIICIGQSGNAVFVAQYAVLSHHVEIRFDIFQMWTPHEGHVMEEGSGDNIVVSTIVSSLVKVCNGNNYQCQLNAEPDQ